MMYDASLDSERYLGLVLGGLFVVEPNIVTVKIPHVGYLLFLIRRFISENLLGFDRRLLVQGYKSVIRPTLVYNLMN